MQTHDFMDRRKPLILDRRKVMEVAMGDLQLLTRLVELFREYYPTLLSNLERAVLAEDADQIAELAHRLKGSVSTFHSAPAIEAARALEFAGRERRLSNISVQFEQLSGQLTALDQALSEWILELTNS